MTEPFYPPPPAPPAHVRPAKRSIAELGAIIKVLAFRIDADANTLGQVLTEAKEQLKHGEWLPFLDQYFPKSARHASELMKTFKSEVNGISEEEGKSTEPLDEETTSDEKQGDDEKAATSDLNGNAPAQHLPELKCIKCRKWGAKKLCKACRKLNKPVSNEKPKGVDSHGRKTKRKKKTQPPRGEIKDKVGNVVPENCRDIFADETFTELIGEIEQSESVIQAASLSKRACGLCNHHPFILIDKFTEHIYEAQHRLQVALEAIRCGLPYAVCPECKGTGEGCKVCRGGKYVPQHRYEELTNGR